MLSIDGSSTEDCSDWFCFHSSSRLIFPIHFCKTNNITLSPPFGKLLSWIVLFFFLLFKCYIQIVLDYHGEFDWDRYLSETNSVSAPRENFQIIKVIKTTSFIYMYIYIFILFFS